MLSLLMQRLDDVEEEPNFGNGGSDEEERSRE
jgi:hypothetical protein